MLSVHYKNESEPHHYECWVAQIPVGKVNHDGTILYSWALRAKDVCLCTLGALGFYLLWRFDMTCEFVEPPDFTLNESWFDIKLLVDSSCTIGDNTSIMSDKSYGDAVKEICRKNEVPSNHIVHIGQEMGPVILEFAEIEDSFIKKLGNWNPDTQNKAYSAKLPLLPMRVAAGHSKAEGCHFNPWIVLEPSEELQMQVFPFVDECLEKVRSASSTPSTPVNKG